MTVKVGTPNIKIDLEKAEALARDAGFSDEFISQLEDEPETLFHQAKKELARILENENKGEDV